LRLLPTFVVEENHDERDSYQHDANNNRETAVQKVSAIEALYSMKHIINKDGLSLSLSPAVSFTRRSRGILNQSSRFSNVLACHYAQKHLKQRLKKDRGQEDANVLEQGQRPSKGKLMSLIVDAERGIEKVYGDEEYQQEQGVEGDKVITPLDVCLSKPEAQTEDLAAILNVLKCLVVFPF
jgi:hypothetical protein